MLSFLSLACLAGVALAGQEPQFRQGYGPVQPVPQPMPSTPEDLPCDYGEGFYAHPKHQNRFYRCVDHAKTGTHFSRYQFHCPVGQVFVKTAKDGLCLPTQTDAGEVPKVPKVPTGTAGSGGYTPWVPPPKPASTIPKPAGSYPSGGGAYPKPGGNPAVYPNPKPVPQPQVLPPKTPGGYPGPGDNAVCKHKYVQDKKHCNVYRACVADGKMYRCKTGSIFDQANQMCRWSYPADDVCAGKKLMSETQFRSFPTSFDDYLVSQHPGLSTLIQSPLDGFNQDAGVDQSMFYIGGVPNQFPQQSVAQFYVGGLDQQASANQQVAYTADSGADTFARNSNGAQAVPTFFPSADHPLVYYF